MQQTRFRLYDAAALEAVIDAMARQIAMRFDATPLTLIGLQRRGVPLAERLHQRIAQLRPEWAIERVDLEVKRYGDDLTLLHPDTRLSATAQQQQADFSGRRLVVVDDVLYQGTPPLRCWSSCAHARPAMCIWRCWWIAVAPPCRCRPISSG